MIEQKGENNYYWRYFLALEEDLIEISRFIELSPDNDWTYSIELAKLLLAASSEVDVVMKDFCKELDSGFGISKPNIVDYRDVIMEKQPGFAQSTVHIRGYGLTLKPWQNWLENRNPDWWIGYNNIKHQRTQYFQDANLNYVLNAMSALLVAISSLYEIIYSKSLKTKFDYIHNFLTPRPKLLETYQEYYQNLLTD